jgi:hypothetical protein
MRNVPPQRRDWWAEEASHTNRSKERVPEEKVDIVLGEEWPMGLRD